MLSCAGKTHRVAAAPHSSEQEACRLGVTTVLWLHSKYKATCQPGSCSYPVCSVCLCASISVLLVLSTLESNFVFMLRAHGKVYSDLGVPGVAWERESGQLAVILTDFNTH